MQVGAQVEVGRRPRTLHDGVGVEHAVQAQILRQRELRQPVQLEARHHQGDVHAPGRRLELRLEAQGAVLAHQVDGL